MVEIYFEKKTKKKFKSLTVGGLLP